MHDTNAKHSDPWQIVAQIVHFHLFHSLSFSSQALFREFSTYLREEGWGWNSWLVLKCVNWHPSLCRWTSGCTSPQKNLNPPVCVRIRKYTLGKKLVIPTLQRDTLIHHHKHTPLLMSHQQKTTTKKRSRSLSKWLPLCVQVFCWEGLGCGRAFQRGLYRYGWDRWSSQIHVWTLHQLHLYTHTHTPLPADCNIWQR